MQLRAVKRETTQELLNDTYKHIAEQYEMKGNLKKAEHYYVEAPWCSLKSLAFVCHATSDVAGFCFRFFQNVFSYIFIQFHVFSYIFIYFRTFPKDFIFSYFSQ